MLVVGGMGGRVGLDVDSVGYEVRLDVKVGVGWSFGGIRTCIYLGTIQFGYR